MILEEKIIKYKHIILIVIPILGMVMTSYQEDQNYLSDLKGFFWVAIQCLLFSVSYAVTKKFIPSSIQDNVIIGIHWISFLVIFLLSLSSDSTLTNFQFIDLT